MVALGVGANAAASSTFAAAAVLCVAMTILGSVVPALRAVRVDPMTVVRTE